MILLDTHVVAWMNLDSRRLSRAASSAIRRAERSDGLAISVITLVELARLIASGRIEQDLPLESALRRLVQDVHIFPISFEIATLTAYFPPDFPSDPMDRIIAATARAEGIPLLTADQRIQSSPLVKTIW
jgi:PIN domain nuclease of toxin-antitoxin system